MLSFPATLLSTLTLTLILLSCPVLARDGTILFCNETGFKDCTIPVQYEWNQCYHIPDSNAKGDRGSSYKVNEDPPGSTCALYEGPHCTGHTPGFYFSIKDMQDDRTYRTFKCLKFALGQ